MSDLALGYIQVLNFFEKAEQNITMLLCQNKDLFKLLRFTDNNPLSHDISDEEIEDTITEFDSKRQNNPNCKLFFEPFNDKVLMSEIAMLRIFPIQITPKDKYEADLYIQTDIIVHQGISKIKGGRRRNRILSEVVDALNGKEINLLQTLALAEDYPVKLVQFKDEFWGYIIWFHSNIAGVEW